MTAAVIENKREVFRQMRHKTVFGSVIVGGGVSSASLPLTRPHTDSFCCRHALRDVLTVIWRLVSLLPSLKPCSASYFSFQSILLARLTLDG